jgi:hypothetical protein
MKWIHQNIEPVEVLIWSPEKAKAKYISTWKQASWFALISPLHLIYWRAKSLEAWTNNILSHRKLSTKEDLRKPNEGISLSLRNGVVVSVLVVLGLLSYKLLKILTMIYPTIIFTQQHFGDLGVSLSETLFVWLPFTLIAGMLAGYHWGIKAVIQHYTLRFVLFITKTIPWNLVRFLDYACDRILLRRVGGGYVFIHRLLLEYFAELSNKRHEI